MQQDARERASQLFQAGRFAEALPLFEYFLADNPSDGKAHYLAGQCSLMLEDKERALRYLLVAARLLSESSSVALALGALYKSNEQWPEAIQAFQHAISIDPDYELSYFHLAVAQRHTGDLEGAVHNNDAALRALARRIVEELENSHSSPVLPLTLPQAVLWLEYAKDAAKAAATAAYIGTVAFTGVGDEQSLAHGGLYWVDEPDGSGGITRLYLPNYFSTIQAVLRQEGIYPYLLREQGTTLELLGRHSEAQQYFSESQDP